jgi:hypothetical protein
MMALKRIVLLIAAMTFLLSSCSTTPGATHDRSAETATPSMPMGTPCPPNSSPAAAFPEVDKRKLLVILVDKSGSYAQWTQPSLELIEHVLPRIVNPGDTVVAAWIGSNSGAPAETFFQDTVPGVNPLTLRPVPDTPLDVPTTTLLPEPTMSDSDSSMGRELTQQTAQAARATNVVAPTHAEATRQANSNNYTCAMDAWLQEYHTAMEELSQARRKSLETFQTEALQALNAAKEIPPIDQATRITDALLVASKIFEDAVADGRYQEYRLLIFSDMVEITGDDAITPSVLRLPQVEVTVAMMACEPAKCRNTQDQWTETFTQAQAERSRFLLVVQSSDDSLVDTLR